MSDLFGSEPGAELPPGVRYLPGYFDRAAQEDLLAVIREGVRMAPLFVPVMPRSGQPMSVRMTNFGPLGWVTDKDRGYRYQDHHPVTGAPWPPMPPTLRALWAAVAGVSAEPEAALVNLYEPGARMGLHQDRDEQAFEAPVVSISLGDSCLFRMGGIKRTDRTRSLKLHSGDVIVFGGESRLMFHGVDRLYPGTSDLLRQPGRINVTLRRVTPVVVS